jgi:anti-sigma regulatory factor (Ser/Thr protein kinase)
MILPSQHQSARTPITDDSGVGEARRVAASWAQALGFDATRAGELALIVTEAASNIARHAGEGELLLRRLRAGASEGIEVLALDRGPGMRNVAQCLVDGYSTRGTAGTGLGGIQRMAELFEVYSVEGKGTVLLAQLWQQAPVRSDGSQWGAVCVPLAGEEVCGDGFAIHHDTDRHLLAVLDGLGHGQGAADATLAGLRVFHANASLGPAEMVERMHEALRPTRGAAVAVLELRPSTRTVRFAGVGNCAGAIYDRAQQVRPQNLTSHNGIVGANIPRLREFSHTWPDDGLVLLHSDGLSTRFHLDDYPGLGRRHPSVIAAVLYRDFGRSRDDATMLAFAIASA